MWLIFSTDSPEIIVKTHKDDDVNEDVDDDVDDDSIEDPEVTALGGDWYVPVLRARGFLSREMFSHHSFFLLGDAIDHSVLFFSAQIFWQNF